MLIRYFNRRNVLLVGEGRSGTSLVLDMLSSSFSGKVFSIYEPYFRFFEKKSRGPRPQFSLAELFNCTFAHNHISASAAVQGWAKITENGVDVCHYKHRQLTDANEQGFGEDVRDSLFMACASASVRISKIIRFREHKLEPPNVGVPGIRVVHLVRHPVPLVMSRARMRFGRHSGNHTEHIIAECTRMLDRSKYLRRHLPQNQLLELRYEDVVGNRLPVMWHNVLRFIGASDSQDAMGRAVEAASRMHRARHTLEDGSYIEHSHKSQKTQRGRESDFLLREADVCTEFLARFNYESLR